MVGIILMIPTIFSPTRGKSCLDHVITNTKLPSYSFVLETALTDHEPVLFCMKSEQKSRLGTTTLVYKYDFKTISKECAETDFSPVYAENDLNATI
jgi:hypothetical protein